MRKPNTGSFLLEALSYALHRWRADAKSNLGKTLRATGRLGAKRKMYDTTVRGADGTTSTIRTQKPRFEHDTTGTGLSDKAYSRGHRLIRSGQQEAAAARARLKDYAKTNPYRAALIRGSVGAAPWVAPVAAPMALNAMGAPDWASTASVYATLPFMYSPAGLATTGAFKALDAGTNYIHNKAAESALNAAEQAARTTAEQIAQGLEENGRMGHLFGLFSNQGYADRVREQADERITKAMKTYRDQILGSNA